MQKGHRLPSQTGCILNINNNNSGRRNLDTLRLLYFFLNVNNRMVSYFGVKGLQVTMPKKHPEDIRRGLHAYIIMGWEKGLMGEKKLCKKGSGSRIVTLMVDILPGLYAKFYLCAEIKHRGGSLCEICHVLTQKMRKYLICIIRLPMFKMCVANSVHVEKRLTLNLYLIIKQKVVVSNKIKCFLSLFY